MYKAQTLYVYTNSTRKSRGAKPILSTFTTCTCEALITYTWGKPLQKSLRLAKCVLTYLRSVDLCVNACISAKIRAIVRHARGSKVFSDTTKALGNDLLSF